jgi:proline iminopeptidase
MREKFYVDVNDIRLYVETIGEGYPLFILHGGPGVTMEWYVDYLDILADNFKVIYFDQRGQGKSDKIANEKITLKNTAIDIIELSKKLGLEKYAVLGHSGGGFLALTLAVDFPKEATHVVLLNTLPNLKGRNEYISKCNNEIENAEMKENVKQSSELFNKAYEIHQDDLEKAKDLYAEAFAIMIRRVFPSFSKSEIEKFLKKCGDNRLDLDVLYGVFGRIAKEYDVEENLKDITKPVLIISGEKDFNCDPQRSYDMHKLIPNSELHILKDSGHYSYIEKPKEIKGYITNFILE